LQSLRDAGGSVRVLRGLCSSVDESSPKRPEDDALGAKLGELRLVKDAAEIHELRSAVAATRRAFDDVVRQLSKVKNEAEVEAIFTRRARAIGNAPGYQVIAAAGSRGCILHYSDNNRPILRYDLLLLDAGVESHSLYTADVTRTLPVSGRFTDDQRAVYEIVYAAKEAATASVAPGADFMAPNRAAQRVLTLGLIQLGVLRTSAEEALREDRQFHKRYTLHNVSHMLGLDVHDCARASKDVYHHGTLRPGMVLTLEPGLYFQPDDLTVPPRLRGIGVRIEDDILVTDGGRENLSFAIPSQVDEVEAWIARLGRRGARRE
jgi:Xaa-Pro aminopeptidase